MATFNFLNAIRDKVDVLEIERLRICGNADKAVQEWKEEGSSEVLYPLSEALRFSIMYGNVHYANFILENFAEKALGPTTCCPLLLLAVRLNNESIVELICSYGRTVQTNSGCYYIDSRGCDMMENGKTALHTAVELGHRGCTKILLKYGANHLLKDSENQTVLERAYGRFMSKPSFAILMCIVDLIDCEKQLQPQSVKLLNDLYERWTYPACFSQIPRTLEVSRLMHLCRSALRHVLRRNLPNAISELPLPNIAKQYLDVSY